MTYFLLFPPPRLSDGGLPRHRVFPRWLAGGWGFWSHPGDRGNGHHRLQSGRESQSLWNEDFVPQPESEVKPFTAPWQVYFATAFNCYLYLSLSNWSPLLSMLGWDAVLSALLLLNIMPGSHEARFAQKSKSSGDFMVIRQGRGQMGAEGSWRPALLQHRWGRGWRPPGELPRGPGIWGSARVPDWDSQGWWCPRGCDNKSLPY